MGKCLYTESVVSMVENMWSVQEIETQNDNGDINHCTFSVAKFISRDIS